MIRNAKRRYLTLSEPLAKPQRMLTGRSETRDTMTTVALESGSDRKPGEREGWPAQHARQEGPTFKPSPSRAQSGAPAHPKAGFARRERWVTRSLPSEFQTNHSGRGPWAFPALIDFWTSDPFSRSVRRTSRRTSRGVWRHPSDVGRKVPARSLILRHRLQWCQGCVDLARLPVRVRGFPRRLRRNPPQ